ncbi:MAG: tetratricopeptide repeat protein, partial [Bacteroidetes bacterium]|nr:tetratricopeptide repeat protein [Bacteroidota bacterium]
EAHYSLGLLLAEKGDYAGALAALETASELVPDYSRIWYNMALLYQHFGREDKFLDAMETALLLEPQNMDYLYAMAEYYYRIRNFDQVRRIANEVIRYYPQDPLGPQLLELVEENR